MAAYLGEWRDLVGSRGGLSDDAFKADFATLSSRWMDLGQLSSQILGDHWDGLSSHARIAFEEALVASLEERMMSYLPRDDGSVPSVHYMRGNEDDTSAVLVYALEYRDSSDVVVFSLEKSAASWQITDIEGSRWRLSKFYHDLTDDLIDDYSFSYMIAELADHPFVVLEDFETDTVGALPANWTWRSGDNEKNKPYAVREEAGNRYLAATDEGESVILGKSVKWNLQEFPYVSFRWRVHRIPEGADERFDKKVDSAAGIYFVYRKKTFGLVPESVKYVWSSTLPVGSAVRRNGIGKPWMVVVESGAGGVGVWHTYVFDLRDAYRRTFGGDPPERPIGIAILSDANSTESQAYADYDDIRALRAADGSVDGGVREILQPGGSQ
jgi:hypothetical protein